MDMLKDLLKKKGKESAPMDPKVKEAKMGVLKEISDMAGKHMGDDIRGLKKVTVASPDADGLKAGLQKAQDLVGKEGSPLHSDDMDESDESESPEDESDEHAGKAAHLIEEEIDEESDEGDLSADEIDALIKDLEDKKMKLSQK